MFNVKYVIPCHVISRKLVVPEVSLCSPTMKVTSSEVSLCLLTMKVTSSKLYIKRTIHEEMCASFSKSQRVKVVKKEKRVFRPRDSEQVHPEPQHLKFGLRS